jgi:hypothetical protein
MVGKIKELQAHGESGQGMILTSDQQQQLDKYQQSMAAVNQQLKQVRKNLRMDTEALEFKTKVINIGAMPLVVALSGISLAVYRTRRQTGRGRPPKAGRQNSRTTDNDNSSSQEISAAK